MAKTKDNQEKPEEMEHREIEYKTDGEKHISFGICKATEIDDEERTVVAVISTGVIDRDSEILTPKGARTENFEKNPVIPWSHNTFDPPIGKALWIKVGTKKILAKVKFAMTDRAEEVWQLFKGKFLRAFSVGFIPLKGHRPTPEEIKKNPDLADARFIFDEWELLEFSPVVVPANPEALATAVKNKSIKISKALRKELNVEEIAEETPENEEEVLIPVSAFKKPEKIIEVEPFFEVDKV